jgi:hypothetical protein
MGGLHWSWSIFAMGCVTAAVTTLVAYCTALHRTGQPPWDQFKRKTPRARLMLYWTQTVLWLPVGGLAAVIAVNIPVWWVAGAAAAAPQAVFVLLGAGKQGDGPDQNGLAGDLAVERRHNMSSLLIEMASAFAASRVSWRVAVAWITVTCAIVIAGLTIALLSLLR